MNGKSTIGSDGDYSVRICVKQWMKYAANILTLMSLLCLIYTNKAVYTATFVAGGWAGAVMSWTGAISIKIVV